MSKVKADRIEPSQIFSCKMKGKEGIRMGSARERNVFTGPLNHTKCFLVLSVRHRGFDSKSVWLEESWMRIGHIGISLH